MPHKKSHTLVAVDPAGLKLGQKTIATTGAAHADGVRWAAAQFGSGAVLWAVEDCRTLTARLEDDLLTAGQRVVRVPPHLMARTRSSARERGKSDPIDALAVARTALREPNLPVAVHDPVSMELRLLVDRRDDLVGQNTATISVARVRPGQLTGTFRDVTERFAAAQRTLAAEALLRATVDSMLDPQMLLEAVRDPAGRVVDFTYREANAAACRDMTMTRDELVGRMIRQLLPEFAESGPMSYYIQCLETGQQGALDDYSYDHEIRAESRRYDIRVAPAGEDLISLSFRDVTERFTAAQ